MSFKREDVKGKPVTLADGRKVFEDQLHEKEDGFGRFLAPCYHLGYRMSRLYVHGDEKAAIYRMQITDMDKAVTDKVRLVYEVNEIGFFGDIAGALSTLMDNGGLLHKKLMASIEADELQEPLLTEARTHCERLKSGEARANALAGLKKFTDSIHDDFVGNGGLEADEESSTFIRISAKSFFHMVIKLSTGATILSAGIDEAMEQKVGPRGIGEEVMTERVVDQPDLRPGSIH